MYVHVALIITNKYMYHQKSLVYQVFGASCFGLLGAVGNGYPITLDRTSTVFQGSGVCGPIYTKTRVGELELPSIQRQFPFPAALIFCLPQIPYI